MTQRRLVPTPRICECASTAFISLTNGYMTLVDAADICFLEKSIHWWALDKLTSVYAMRTEDKKNIRLHREILSTSLEIDHKNGNGLDNRRSNLRPATRAENRRNRKKYRPTHASSYKGVYFDAERGWHARITVDKSHKRLGCFNSEIEAALAYDAAAAKYHGQFARLNFPPKEALEANS